ncbi:hypothetical protein DFH07DRAFT_443279, partial [Mycena maculata]
LPNAPSTIINGGTFIGGNVNNIQRHGEAGLHILHRAISGDAFHDSAERYPQPRCHPDTRTELLDVLWKWAYGIEPPRNWTSHDPQDDEEHQAASCSHEDNEPSSSILWLYGPAGSGKSAIAQSLCQKLKEEGRLGGSFFFKRGHPSRGNAKKLLPTLAYQLALLLPDLKQLISQTVENDPAIVDRTLSHQLQELIIGPCRRSSLSTPASIIIDGLDECDGQDIQQEILREIGNVVHQQHLPILFFIASRPESHIRETFAEPGLNGFHRPLNINQSFQDVRKYLLDEFSRIRREHPTMASVPSPWPRAEIVEELVEKSSGYFIYVSTVVKFIDDKRFRPGERLDIILGIKNSTSGSPFDTLDQLYHQILCAVPLDFRPQLLEILRIIIVTPESALSVSEIELLLELKTGDVRLILRDLHSVINIPEVDSDLAVHHASFLDFLDDSSRSGAFYIGSSQCRTNFSYHVLKAFSSRHDDPSGKRPVAWQLNDPFEYITSADPTPNLLPLVGSLNPYFFFGDGMQSESAMHVLHWLKKFNPQPEGLVRLWEDYRFMALCDEAWNSTRLRKERQLDNCHDILSRTSPQLIKILSSYRVFPKICDGCFLVRIHFLLGLSWEELRTAICPLRGILGDDPTRLQELLIFDPEETFLGRQDSDSLLLELARGGLRG